MFVNLYTTNKSTDMVMIKLQVDKHYLGYTIYIYIYIYTHTYICLILLRWVNSELQKSTNWIVQWALRQWFRLAEADAFIMMWK